jgi:hypothetical protein
MTIWIYPHGELSTAFFFVLFVFRLFLYHKEHKVVTKNTKLEMKLLYMDNH